MSFSLKKLIPKNYSFFRFSYLILHNFIIFLNSNTLKLTNHEYLYFEAIEIPSFI
jgi:hypothetical protein